LFSAGKQHGATIRQVKLRGLPKVSDVFTLSCVDHGMNADLSVNSAALLLRWKNCGAHWCHAAAWIFGECTRLS